MAIEDFHPRTNRRPVTVFYGRVSKAAFALVSLSALSACSESQGAPPAPPPAEVSVLRMEPQRVAVTTDLPGRATAFLIADVRPQVGGVVVKRTFVEGGDVTAGQPLYLIDPATYQATYDSSMATLAKNKAAFTSAEAKAKRYKPLASVQAVSRQDFDDAIASAAEAEADVGTAMASLEQAKINLAYTKVMAPITGTIGRSTVTPGALVTSQQTSALATVTQLDPIYVDVTQSSATMLRLRQELAAGKIQKAGANSAKVGLALEDGTLYPRTGTLQFSEVNVDQGTGTVLTRAIFPNPDHILLPGMFVHAEIQEGINDKAFLVPQESVSRNVHGDATVLLVDVEGNVSLQIVRTERAIGDKWVVTAGLKAGDRLIIEGVQKARPGAHVRVVDASTASTKD